MVSFNANETTVNGRIWADTVSLSGSIFNIRGSDSDLDLIGETDAPTEYSFLSQGNSIYGYEKEFVQDEWSSGRNTTFGTSMVELVPNRYSMNGHFYYKIGKNFENDASFSARFTFSADYTSSLADGFAFVMQPEYNVSGGSGGGMGYEKVKPSVAVEFDNYQNVPSDGYNYKWKDSFGHGEWQNNRGREINGNHIGVMVNGNAGDHYALCNYETLRTNGAVSDAWIEYDGREKVLYISAAPYDENGNVQKPQSPMIACKIDIPAIFEGQDLIYFGITSATGGSCASHKLHGVEFDPEPEMLDYSGCYEEYAEPEITVTASSERVCVNDAAYFTVSTEHAERIESISYTLNGAETEIADGRYLLDTSDAGVYTLTANAVSVTGKEFSSSASIEVVKASKPVIDLVFDKESYCVGEDVVVTVNAYDENELFVEIASPDDAKEITAPTDIIGSAKGSGLVKYTLEYAPAGTNEFTAIREGTEAVDGGVLGQLDPTMLRNGYYDIRLTGLSV